MNWVRKYENATNDYRLTKPTPVSNVNISFLYTIDCGLPISDEKTNLEIKDIVNINYELPESGIIDKDALLELLMKHKTYNGISYNSFKIMHFNINSEAGEDFIFDDDTDFSSQLNGVGNIIFDHTLGIFDDYNNVYIMFKRRTKRNNTYKTINFKGPRKTKRQYFIK